MLFDLTTDILQLQCDTSDKDCSHNMRRDPKKLRAARGCFYTSKKVHLLMHILKYLNLESKARKLHLAFDL